MSGGERDGAGMNRREFVGSVALVTGGIAVSAVVPGVSPPAMAAQSPPATLSDWTIDDMWGVYPRYADPIGYGRPLGRGETAAVQGSIDALFYA